MVVRGGTKINSRFVAGTFLTHWLFFSMLIRPIIWFGMHCQRWTYQSGQCKHSLCSCFIRVKTHPQCSVHSSWFDCFFLRCRSRTKVCEPNFLVTESKYWMSGLKRSKGTWTRIPVHGSRWFTNTLFRTAASQFRSSDGMLKVVHSKTDSPLHRIGTLGWCNKGIMNSAYNRQLGADIGPSSYEANCTRCFLLLLCSSYLVCFHRDSHGF